MKYTTVVFDFDGTIADTQQQMLQVSKVLAAEFGFNPITLEEIPALRKMGARELVVRRLNIPLWNVVKIYRLERRGRALLAQHAGAIQIFPGMKESIVALKHAGLRTGIVTSNSHEVVAKALGNAGVAVDFVHAGSAFFGKDKAISHALSAQKIDPASVVYIGDELRDVEACKKIGVAMIGVSWGYNDALVLRESGIAVVDKAEELTKRLLET